METAKTNTWIILIFLCLAVLLYGCSDADTLGDEEPQEVHITGTPTWENGIRRLMKLKCALCHTIPFTDVTPENAPQNLNLTEYESTDDVRGAVDIVSWINAGILEKSVANVRQMPLEYSTPLTQSEIEALTMWATQGGPKNDE